MLGEAIGSGSFFGGGGGGMGLKELGERKGWPLLREDEEAKKLAKPKPFTSRSLVVA